MVALKTLMFTILVPGTLWGIVPWLLLHWSGEAVMPSLSVWLIGLLPFFVGVILYFWCAGAFTLIGRGTPAPIDAPVFLVRSGPYRWVRNPMYLGVFSVLLGEAILFHSLLLAGCGLLMGVVVHLFVVFYEDPRCVAGLVRAMRPTCVRFRAGCPGIRGSKENAWIPMS